MKSAEASNALSFLTFDQWFLQTIFCARIGNCHLFFIFWLNLITSNSGFDKFVEIGYSVSVSHIYLQTDAKEILES